MYNFLEDEFYYRIRLLFLGKNMIQ